VTTTDTKHDRHIKKASSINDVRTEGVGSKPKYGQRGLGGRGDFGASGRRHLHNM